MTRCGRSEIPGEHPTDRILAVLQRNDGTQFDQHLVRRFVQLVGIYPPGNLVRLDNGDIAVVVKPYAPDPYRPRVKVVIRASGQKVERPFDMNLWEARAPAARGARTGRSGDGGYRPASLSLAGLAPGSGFRLRASAGPRYNDVPPPAD